jgi:hypothetical protein
MLSYYQRLALDKSAPGKLSTRYPGNTVTAISRAVFDNRFGISSRVSTRSRGQVTH